MIRFCTEAETKQPENTAPLLYRSRQQMEADRQVSRSWQISNAKVIRAARREEEQERGPSNLWRPMLYRLHLSCLQEQVRPVSFSKSQTVVRRKLLVERKEFSWFCFQDTTPELPEKTMGTRRAGPWRQGRTQQHL